MGNKTDHNYPVNPALWVCHLRDRLGLTQKELAAYLGVHENTIHNWEKGVYAPSYKNIALLKELEEKRVAPPASVQGPYAKPEPADDVSD